MHEEKLSAGDRLAIFFWMSMVAFWTAVIFKMMWYVILGVVAGIAFIWCMCWVVWWIIQLFKDTGESI